MTIPAKASRKSRKVEVFIVLFATAWFLANCLHGINTVDGAVQIYFGYLISRGLVLYRDVFAPFTPLPFLIQAGMNRLFGVHLITGQVYAVVQCTIAVMITLRICRRHLDYPFSLIPALLYIPYSVALGGFPHYNMDVWFFSLATLALLDEYLHRPGPATIFLAGLFAALAIASKQSIVAVVIPLIALAILLAAGKERQKIIPHLAWAGLGIFLPAFLILIRYARANALEEAWANLTGMSGMKRVVLFSILPRASVALGLGLALVRILIQIGRRPRFAAPLWAAAITGGVLFIIIAPGPVPGSIIAGLVAASLLAFVRPGPGHKAGSWILIRAYGILFFITSLLSGVDLSHVLIASAGAVFGAGLLFQNLWHGFNDTEREARSKEPGITSIRAVALFGLGVVFLAGVYLDLSLVHMSHIQEPRWKATSKVHVKGLEFMRASPQQARELEATVGWIREHSAPGEKIFVYPWDLLIYVLAERLPATYDYFFYFEVFDQKVLRRVIADLDKNRPRIVVVRMAGDKVYRVAFAEEASVLEGYIKTHYAPAARFGNYRIMTRKISPAE